MKALRFSFIPDVLRHRLMLVAVGLAGAMGAWLLWPLDSIALEALRLEVAQLQMQAQAQAQAPQISAARQQGPVPEGPVLAESARAWPWLQQRLRAHGLQVQLLRPQAVTGSRPLPEQAVAVRLQGRWRDWLAFEAALHRHAPWWVIDQWQVVPAGLPSDEVRIELQARLGFRPPAWQDQATDRVWPEWPVLAGGQPGDDLFAQAPTPTASAVAGETPMPLSTDPRAWPVHALRLLGVWQQAGTAHAVLGEGLNQVVVRQGQRIGREAYRVRRIGDDQVELAAADPAGQVLRLTLHKEKP